MRFAGEALGRRLVARPRTLRPPLATIREPMTRNQRAALIERMVGEGSSVPEIRRSARHTAAKRL